MIAGILLASALSADQPSVFRIFPLHLRVDRKGIGCTSVRRIKRSSFKKFIFFCTENIGCFSQTRVIVAAFQGGVPPQGIVLIIALIVVVLFEKENCTKGNCAVFVGEPVSSVFSTVVPPAVLNEPGAVMFGPRTFVKVFSGEAVIPADYLYDMIS